MGNTGKLLIFSAPSGSGKSTIINYLMSQSLNLSFSISATSRLPRGNEVNGREYYFLSPEAFRQKIEADAFLEWEEVYTDKYYGTLKEVVEQMRAAGKNVIFDVDVVGGCNIKKYYADQALSIFVMPPDIATLRERLVKRAVDALEVIENRLAKAEYELTFAPRFDKIVVNDDLEKAQQEVLKLVTDFIQE